MIRARALKGRGKEGVDVSAANAAAPSGRHPLLLVTLLM